MSYIRITEDKITRITLEGDISFTVLLTPEEVEAYAAYAYTLKQHFFVKAIKTIRNEFGCGLKEAKRFVEAAKPPREY